MGAPFSHLIGKQRSRTLGLVIETRLVRFKCRDGGEW